jgi:hypothetical protein
MLKISFDDGFHVLFVFAMVGRVLDVHELIGAVERGVKGYIGHENYNKIILAPVITD